MKKMIALLCAVVLVASAVIGVTNVRSSNKIKSLNADLAALQETADASAKDAEAKAQEIDTLMSDVAEKAAQIESLNADLEAKAQEIDTLMGDAAEKAAQIETLNAQAAEAQEKIDALTAEVAEKNAQVESLTEELNLAQQKLQTISEALNGPAAEAQAKAALPAVGDVVNGFEVKEIRDFPLIGATAVLFEHQKTGAKLTYLANEDTNRVFDLTFLTRPIDNTGLPHVFEHSTLQGSEKYPSKALFFNLMYQTYNTYMNAYTMDAMTSYPVASLSEAQLLKYADFYTDSCLHPMIMTDESIYRDEAWRYRMASMDDDLTIEGTVYSEMLGALDLSAMSMLNANRAAFPGSSLCYEYGGDPDFIPDMTWEDLKEYHNLYYHPSNCMAYLYGQFEDYAAFLALLDEAFAPYEKKEFSTEQPDYTAITAPVVQKIGFPTEADSSAENQTAIWYYIVCPGMRQDRQAEQVMDNLTSLLNSESSLLMQNLKKALPTGSFSVGREVAAPDDAIAFTAMNVNENDAELFVQTIEESLRQIAETGFPQDMVDGYMATVSLNTKLTAESKEVGTNIIRSIAYSYATTGEPFKYFTDVEILDQLDAWNQEGLYQKAIADWLLDRETTALVTTYPMPGEKEAKDAALAARLAEIKAGMTEEEKQAIIDATNAEDTDEDTSAMVSQLQAVTVESLPEEVKLYDVSDAQGEDGIRRVNTVAGVDGVGRVALFLDAQGLPQEDIHWFKLFMDMIGKLDTDAHTKEELDVLASRYLYGSEVRLSLMGDGENYHPYLRMGWTGMDDDLSTAYDLMYELVFGTQFTDAQKLLEKVQAAKTSLRSSINNSPYNVLLYRALSIANPLYRYYSYINFVDYYAFLEQVEAALEQSPETVLAKLQAIQATMNNSTNAVIGFAGNEKSIAVNAPLADAFMARLGSAPIEAVSYDLPVPAKREALIVDSSVQYNALVADYAALGMEEYDASLDAVMTLISDTFLIPQLRDQYGVYTPWAGAITDGGVYLLTYRDPNVRETFTVYESLPEQVAALDVDQETLDGYILSSYAYYATSEGELTGAMSALTATINGDAQDKALEYMRELKAMTPESVSASAKMFQLLAENGIRSTAGSASAINANADLYDVILNPFNAKDTSDVVFTDLTEDSPYTAAARFMMDNGLMTPKAEDSFGAMEEANVGDFAVPLSILNGGASDPEGAVQFLISAGLFTSDTLVTEELPREDLIAIGNTLSGGALEIQLPESDAVNATRGDVALMYYQLMN